MHIPNMLALLSLLLALTASGLGEGKFSTLVARAGESPTTPPVSTIVDAQPMDWDPPSSPGPSQGPASPANKRKTHPSSSRPRKGKRPAIPEKSPEDVSYQRVPLDPNRKNVPHPERSERMHSIVSPDPTKFKGLKDPITGKRSYYRSTTDDHDTTTALETLAKHSGAVKPSYLMATSENQLGRNFFGDRYGPGKWQEQNDIGTMSLSKEPVWFRVTPMEYPDYLAHLKTWPDAKLRKNLVHQQLHFPNHEAGQGKSMWAKIDLEMGVKCKTQICTAENPTRGWITGSQSEEPLTPKKKRSLARRFSH